MLNEFRVDELVAALETGRVRRSLYLLYGDGGVLRLSARAAAPIVWSLGGGVKRLSRIETAKVIARHQDHSRRDAPHDH